MTISAELAAAKKLILETLLAAGWTAADDFGMTHTYAVASKDYETAVGIKTAKVALEPRSENFAALVGDYQSEGSNILSTTWFTIPHGLSAEEISAGAATFALKVDAEVDRSYARRLRKTQG